MPGKVKPVQESLEDVISRIRSFNPEACNEPRGKEPIVDFAAAYDSTKKIVNLYKSIDIKTLDILPEKQREKFTDEAIKCHQLLMEMSNFEQNIVALKENVQKNGSKQLTSDAVIDKSRDIANNIDTLYENLFSRFFVLLLKSGLEHGIDSDKVSKLLDDIVVERKFDLTEMKTAYDTKLVEISNGVANMKNVEEACRQAIGEMNLVTQSSYFMDEAGANSRMIRWSIASTAVLFIALIFAACVILYYSYQSYNNNDSMSFSVLSQQFVFPKRSGNIYDYLQLALAKLVLIGILVYGLVLSAKTLFAHLHNYTINRHRHNAIASFRRFVESLDEKDEARKLIIAQVAATVFAPQETGFISGHAEMPSVESFLKVLKEFSGSAKPSS